MRTPGAIDCSGSLVFSLDWATARGVDMMMVGRGRLIAILLVGCLMCGMVLYSGALRAFFLSDDFVILHLVSQRGPFGIWTHSDSDFFRPAMSAFFFLQYRLWHLNPFGFHLTNIIVHSLNSFLVGLVTWLLLHQKMRSGPRSWMCALAAGFAFLIWPAHSEPVSWVAAGPDVFAGFFGLACLAAYLAYRRQGKRFYLVVSLGLMTCGLLSKESLIGLPLVLVFYEIYAYFAHRQGPAGSWKHLLVTGPYLGLVAVSFWLRYLFLGTPIGGYGRAVHLNVDPLRIARNLVAFPARTLVPPLPTSILDFTPISRLGHRLGSLTGPLASGLSPDVAAASTLAILVFGLIVVVLAVSVYVVAARRRSRVPGLPYFLALAYFASLLPVVNLTVHLADTQGERLLYFPSVFAVILLVFVLSFLVRAAKHLLIVMVCLSLAWGLLLRHANLKWNTASEISKGIVESTRGIADGDRLFIANLPDNIRGAYIYRNGLPEAVDLLAGGRFTEVIPLARYALDRSEDTALITHSDHVFTIQASNPDAHFIIRGMRGRTRLRMEDFEIVSYADSTYVVKLSDLAAGDRLALYASGRLLSYDFE